MEVWKKFRDTDYLISDHGNIFSNKRDRLLTKVVTRYGYERVGLFHNKKAKNYLVHCLVAEAFLGPKPDGMMVNHKDSNRVNNNLSNLEYVTARENMCHSRKQRGKLIGFFKRSRECESYRAAIDIDGKTVYLGSYKTKEAASKAYRDACKKYGIENRYAGEVR